jgi:type II secretory pathway pseudopilin PulG
MKPFAPKKPRVCSRAFTLVELIVGGFIITLIMLSATGVIVTGMRQLRDARAITEVSQIMDSQYESLRKLNFSTLVANYGLADTADSVTTVDLSASALSPGFTAPADFGLTGVFKTLEPSAGDEAYGLIEVTLTAVWKSPTGKSQQQKTYTCFSELGLSDYVVIGF